MRNVRIVATELNRAEVFAGDTKITGVYRVEIEMNAGKPHTVKLHVHPAHIDVTALEDTAHEFVKGRAA